MSIRRARLPFEGQYVQIPNEWMRDQRLSHRARGLLAEIMTHSEGWVVSLGSLWRSAPEGREAIRKAILELVEHGYLARDQGRGEQGRFGEINYVLTDPRDTAAATPEAEPSTVTQKLENGSFTGARSTAPQESTPKEEHLEEHHPEERATPSPSPVDISATDGGAGPVPRPWCRRHAATEGTDRPCTACKHAALLFEQSLTPTAPTGAPSAPRLSKAWRPGLCGLHLQKIGECEMCEREGVA